MPVFEHLFIVVVCVWCSITKNYYLLLKNSVFARSFFSMLSQIFCCSLLLFYALFRSCVVRLLWICECGVVSFFHRLFFSLFLDSRHCSYWTYYKVQHFSLMPLLARWRLSRCSYNSICFNCNPGKKTWGTTCETTPWRKNIVLILLTHKQKVQKPRDHSHNHQKGCYDRIVGKLH